MCLFIALFSIVLLSIMCVRMFVCLHACMYVCICTLYIYIYIHAVLFPVQFDHQADCWSATSKCAFMLLKTRGFDSAISLLPTYWFSWKCLMLSYIPWKCLELIHGWNDCWNWRELHTLLRTSRYIPWGESSGCLICMKYRIIILIIIYYQPGLNILSYIANTSCTHVHTHTATVTAIQAITIRWRPTVTARSACDNAGRWPFK